MSFNLLHFNTDCTSTYGVVICFPVNGSEPLFVNLFHFCLSHCDESKCVPWKMSVLTPELNSNLYFSLRGNLWDYLPAVTEWHWICAVSTITWLVNDLFNNVTISPNIDATCKVSASLLHTNCWLLGVKSLHIGSTFERSHQMGMAGVLRINKSNEW